MLCSVAGNMAPFLHDLAKKDTVRRTQQYQTLALKVEQVLAEIVYVW